MKVKELISLLHNFDPELPVIYDENGTSAIIGAYVHYDALWLDHKYDPVYARWAAEEKERRYKEYQRLRAEFEVT